MTIFLNRSVNDFDVNEVEKDKSIKGCGNTTIKSQSNGSVTGKWNNVKESRDSSSTTNVQRERKTRQVKNTGDITAEQQKQQDDYYQRYIIKEKSLSYRYSYHKMLQKYSANIILHVFTMAQIETNDKSGISCSVFRYRILNHFVYS